MTATDDLRAMLDERGVEYEGNKDVTRFFGYDGFEIVMQEDIDGKLDCLTPLYLTPEQAVEATLGRGTCKVVSKPCDMWECECGKVWWHGGAPNYCPSCGRKVMA